MVMLLTLCHSSIRHRKAIAKLVKQMRKMENDQRVETEVMGDLKIFFRFLLYQCCEDLGNKVIDGHRKSPRTKAKLLQIDKLESR